MESNSNNCTRHNPITLIIKVVDFCNFACGFCRYPNNPRKTTMSFSDFSTIVQKVCDFNISNGGHQVCIIFHGGEPLLWGFDNFVSAMNLEKTLTEKIPNLKFNNCIQTNGSLLDDKWIDFFYKNEFEIGISIDGPKAINFHHGLRDNKNVIDNIKKLAKKNCKFGILSVITNDHEGYADKYYDFLVENNIHSVGFCYCVYDYDKHITVSNKVLTNFLKKLFVRYFEGDYKLSIREFDSVIKKCLNIPAHACTFADRQSCGNYFSVRPNGNVYFCDPYVLDTPSIGNIKDESFYDIVSKPELLEIVKIARDSSRKGCKGCEINSICGGGCFRNTLSNGQSIFCETYKELYPFIKTYVRSSE